MKILLLIISVLPTILLALYMYNKDTLKEPKGLLIVLFLSGFISAAMVVIINTLNALILPEFYLSNNYPKYSFIKLFILIFLQVALIEELSKWVMIRFLAYNNKYFDQFFDIILYSTFVALGFATIENILYVIEGGINLGIYRAIFSVPGHAAFGVFMGYYLGLSKIWYKKNKFTHKYYMFLSILIPSLLHTLYNFFLMLENSYYLFIFLGFIILLYLYAFKKINKVVNIDKKMIKK